MPDHLITSASSWSSHVEKVHVRGAWGLAGGGEGLVVELQVLATAGSVLQA